MNRTDRTIPFLTRNQNQPNSIPDQIIDNYLKWMQKNKFFDENGWQINKKTPEGKTIEPPTLQQWTDNTYEQEEITQQQLYETDQLTTHCEEQPITPN